MPARYNSQMRSIKTPARISGKGNGSGTRTRIRGRRWMRRLKKYFSTHDSAHFVCALDYVCRQRHRIHDSAHDLSTFCAKCARTSSRFGNLGHKLNFEQNFSDEARPNTNKPQNECDIYETFSVDAHAPSPSPDPMHSFTVQRALWVSVQQEQFNSATKRPND